MKEENKRYLVLIPAYNEEKSIATVIKSIFAQHSNFNVLVIDDGSVDRTAEFAKSAGAQVISLPNNLGIGGAMQTGYLYASRHNYDIAVQIDADGQHKPQELEKIIKPIVNHTADLVVGSRYVEKTNYQSTFSRRIGMVILSFLVRRLTKQNIHDTTSGFRAVNKKIINLFSREYSNDYPEVDSLVLVKRKGFIIKEVSVEMEQRLAGNSTITPMKSAYYMAKVSLALLIKAMR